MAFKINMAIAAKNLRLKINDNPGKRIFTTFLHEDGQFFDQAVMSDYATKELRKKGVTLANFKALDMILTLQVVGEGYPNAGETIKILRIDNSIDLV